jgi:hypothetical protein
VIEWTSTSYPSPASTGKTSQTFLGCILPPDRGAQLAAASQIG